MRIAVFGATGGTGCEIVSQALRAGHQVNILVRDLTRVNEVAQQANIIVGDVLVPEKVQEAISGVNAVAVSLGSRKDSPENTVSEGTLNIINAMKAANVKRIVAVTSLGLGESKNQVPLAFRMVMRTVMRKIIADKERQESFIRESGLDWVIVRPGELSNDSPTGEYSFGTELSIVAGRISRADVAEFVLRNLSDDQFLYQAVAIT